MLTVLLYSITLMVGVLVSELARRSVMSTAVLFLAVGVTVGSLGWISPHPDQPVVAQLAELALVATLYTDGLRIGYRELFSGWHLPVRALLVGLPLTLLAIAGIGHWIAGLDWWPALLVGAALSPTDPVFAAAIVGNQNIPQRVRHLLNVESGLNDGLALPIVIILLGRLGAGSVDLWTLLGELGGGVVIGVAVPALSVWLYRRRMFGAAASYKPLFGLAVLLLVWTICSAAHANAFLGAFAAGITLSSLSEPARHHFEPVGEHLAELLKLGALFVFGAVISLEFLGDIDIGGYVFAGAVTLVARPAALLISLAWSHLLWPERLTTAWFGPKGFASVVFGLLIVASSVPGRVHLFHLIALAVAGSILAHSSTDYLVGRWFSRRSEQDGAPAWPESL